MIDPIEKGWKPAHIKPMDDQTILVSWKDYEGTYHGPYRAYWVEDENRFFSICGDEGIPIQVDIWIEIPELPK